MFERVGGSFRDPAGQVFDDGHTILRTVTGGKIEDFLKVQAQGVLERLRQRGQIVSSTDVTNEHADMLVGDVRRVLRHERLDYISYPYEWCFGQLKDAALLTLDLQIELLENEDITLADNTAYNVQFDGWRPLFIDVLSLQKYAEGTPWVGYGQFCEQFLNPLLLQSKLDIDFRHWYRGSVDGIATLDLCKMLKWHHFLSPGVFSHVYLHARSLEKAFRASHDTNSAGAEVKLPKARLLALFRYMRLFINSLEAQTKNTTWAAYETTNTYERAASEKKRGFVAEFVEKAKPNTLIDLGCNAGEFSVLSLAAGARHVVGFDFDSNAVEIAYARAKADELNLLPLQLDAFNPSPSQGWRQCERMGFADRAQADAVIALAFEHHLAIAKNAPLDEVIDWIVAIAPHGIIEFVPKSDPTVQVMLRGRQDIFPDYTPENFTDALRRSASIVRNQQVTDDGRTLFQFQR